MLFQDESCISENTIQRQVDYYIHELLGSNWFGIMSLSPHGNAVVDSCYDVSHIGNNRPVAFVIDNAAELMEQPYDYKTFLCNQVYYAVFPIRTTVFGHKIFLLHCRMDAPFDEKDLRWYKVYSKVAYDRLLLENEYIQDKNYIDSVLESTNSIIAVFDKHYNVVSANTVADYLLGEETSFVEFAIANIKNSSRLIHAFDEVISSEVRRQLENVVVSRNGDNRILNVVVTPLRNSKNVVSGVVFVGTDVTNQQVSGFEFEQLKHYGLLGEISLGLSHDVKNPLMNILNCANLVNKSHMKSAKGRELMGFIISEVKRIDEIIEQMLSFGNVAKKNTYRLLDINDILMNCAKIVNRQKIYRRIDIRCNLENGIPHINAKNSDMQQIFLNILINSIQSIENNGEIVIASKTNAEKDKITITISDNGCGISEKDKSKIFSPYYTTKENGTGLGLFMVSRVLEQYDGSVKLSSMRWEGTVCSITLPVPRETAASAVV